MRALPIGVPKVMITTLASGNTRPYVDIADVTMIYPVVDIAGLNRISNPIMEAIAVLMPRLDLAGQTRCRALESRCGRACRRYRRYFQMRRRRARGEPGHG